MKHLLGSEVAFPGLVPHAASCATANAVHAATTAMIDRIADRTDGKVPERLDEALHYAVARIEKDPRNVAAILRHLGWDGHDGRNDDRYRPRVSLSRQRLQRIVDRAIDRLRADGMIPEVVERSIALIERLVPALDLELCKALLNARLCYVRFSSSALASAAAVFRRHSPFEIGLLSRICG